MSYAELNFLVVEDHDLQRRIATLLLKSRGARTVHEAENGQQALEILRDPARPVQVVITDLDMPEMDGMEFIRRIGEAGRPVSIIVARSQERPLLAAVATMAEAYGIALLGVAEKPLTAEKLAPLIGRHKPPAAAPARKGPAGPAFTLDEIAAALRNGEFEPFMQPKVELATGRLKGAEALARWRHPRLGFVAPYAFIPQLEDSGLIDLLTWTMLEKSARFCSAWRASGADVTVSVNVSLRSLGDAAIADRVTRLVRSQDLDPRHMVLEVTESCATTEVGKALENLARLRMKGFGLSIDDYGTGYSSMQQLTRVAFTELKIDRSFVANAARASNARVILESSLDMARKLNIAAVAEGVETQDVWDLLRELGCELAQGYFIARPMECAGFRDWARAREKPERSSQAN
jgi:EAL domain-containing protein (putative c-di-GMP-specific phosphodiesterase class I)/ActR/RegA family two-component response regulator